MQTNQYIILTIAFFISIFIKYYKIKILEKIASYFVIFYFGISFVYLLKDTNKDFYILFTIGVLVWFLLESAFFWISILVVSKSGFTLFYNYKKDKYIWPASKKYLLLKEKIEEENFILEEFSSTNVEDIFDVKNISFINKNKNIRLFVYFVKSTKKIDCFFNIYSFSNTEKVFLTTNYNYYDAIIYPENYIIKKFKYTSNFKKILNYHKKQIEKEKLKNENFDIVKIENPPLLALKKEQNELDLYNVNNGILFKKQIRQEDGVFTNKGKNLLLKNIYKKKYFF